MTKIKSRDLMTQCLPAGKLTNLNFKSRQISRSLPVSTDTEDTNTIFYRGYKKGGLLISN